jgi:phenylacetate-CoA ligase
LIERHTGGSTGRPTVIRRTWMEERLLNAFRFRADRLLGFRYGDRIAIIGMNPERQRTDRQMLSRVLRRSGLRRVLNIDCRQPLAQVLDQLERWQPDVINGYASAISLVAQAVIASGRRSVRPRCVATGGEVLTPLMRQQMTDAFGARVFDVYGCHEFNLIGWECPESGAMHTCDDLLVVEVLRGSEPVAPGQRGEVVGTSLHSYACPIIRFRIEDVVTRATGRCGCGLPHGTIGDVQGRMLDYFPLPDGRLFDPLQIIGTVLHDRAAWLRQYQVVQVRRDLVVLRAVVTKMPAEERLREIRAHAHSLLGGADFEIEFAPTLELGPTGKFRLAHSLIRSRDDPFDWSQVAELAAPARP